MFSQKKIKWIILSIFTFLFLGQTFAADLEAKVISLSGKVEYANGTNWEAAQEGLILNKGSTISTGFRSTAVLQIGSAKVTVKALSRLTVQELAEQAGLISADIFLQVGRVNADVAKVPEKTLNYQFKSPIATASVRGTELDFDGVTLKVIHGSVDYISPKGQRNLVNGGQKVTLNLEAPAGQIQGNQELLAAESQVNSDPSADLSPDPVANITTNSESKTIKKIPVTIIVE